ncbi:hypothetical protein HH310_19420 [Actinoplanes sp. TBRC 11911]|uniref:hypothetical protein n=1 Tax=Actinoplanes sp. TBRC 11911 TaxID=2729386 RepID=UPI00145F74AE|nr:hypothetical protein [Actinoplanes sp. TBRC 11911]NMO53349.1 hypothetical protein [Actinoplanes sp. TBRC 11911]
MSLPLRLTGAHHQTFATTAGPPDHDLRRYWHDAAAGYGRSLRDDTLTLARPVAFDVLAAPLLAKLAPGPIDLVVLAHATPEGEPRASAGCVFTERLPGVRTTFSVTEQGRTSAFAALLLAGTFPARGRVLVLVLDQSVVPWEVPDATDVPAVDAVVALLFETGGSGVRWEHHAGVTPGEVVPVLTSFAPDTPAVLGQGMPAGDYDRLGVPLIATAPGLLCTSAWAQLPGLMTGGHERVLLADYDATLRSLSLAEIDLRARPDE